MGINTHFKSGIYDCGDDIGEDCSPSNSYGAGFLIDGHVLEVAEVYRNAVVQPTKSDGQSMTSSGGKV